LVSGVVRDLLPAPPRKNTAAGSVPVTAVAAILGLSNSSTTLPVYSHAPKGAERVPAHGMDGILKGIKSTA